MAVIASNAITASFILSTWMSSAWRARCWRALRGRPFSARWVLPGVTDPVRTVGPGGGLGFEPGDDARESAIIAEAPRRGSALAAPRENPRRVQRFLLQRL